MTEKKRIPEGRLAFVILTAVAIFLVGIIMITGRGAVQFHPLVVLTFLVNIGLFLWQLLRAVWHHPFSFDMMHWLFCLFFFGYAPLLQHLTDTYAWRLEPTFGEIIGANALVLLWAAFYLLGRDYRKIHRLRRLADALGEKLHPLLLRIRGWMPAKTGHPGRFARRNHTRTWIPGKKGILNLLLALAVFCAAADILTVGLVEQISRSTAGADTGSTALNLIMTHGINNILLFVAAVFVIEAKKAKKIGWKTVAALLCMLLACFPTGLSRNMMASFYAGMLILTLDCSRKGRWFSWVIFAGLILIFPAMEVFRWIKNVTGGNLFALIMDSFQTSYLDGHFDAHQMIITIFRYVEEFGLAGGRQILGALLFFVPRSIWPGKPEGTGHTAIVELDQFYFSNVSATLPAEGYVNFGLVGVILFAVLIGILVRRIDGGYWRKGQGQELKLVDFLYPFSVFMFFFLLRGDMMSAWAYTFAQIVVGSFVYAAYRYGLRRSPEES